MNQCGVEVFGVDLSPEMVNVAGSANPQIEFVQGDMMHLGMRPAPTHVAQLPLQKRGLMDASNETSSMISACRRA